MRVVFFGPPGVGKGSQAELVAKAMDYNILSMGDILREEIRAKSTIGVKVENFLQRGSLVPDELILEVVDDFLLENRGKGVIFDGFPRNLHQAIALEQALSRLNEAVSFAIGFVLERDEIVKRLTQRRYCNRCNAIYNLTSGPSIKPGVCDECGGELTIRGDDRESVIVERLKVYESQTKPLIEYYSGLGIYRPVDAGGSKQEVYSRVMGVLDAHHA